MILPLSLALCFLPFVLADFISIPLKFDDNGRYLLNLNTVLPFIYLRSIQIIQLTISTTVHWVFPAIFPNGSINEH